MLYRQPIHTMKTMIRIAGGLMAASFVGLSTNCSHTPVQVEHIRYVNRYHYYDRDHDSSWYRGNVYYTPGITHAESFEPVERF